MEPVTIQVTAKIVEDPQWFSPLDSVGGARLVLPTPYIRASVEAWVFITIAGSVSVWSPAATHCPALTLCGREKRVFGYCMLTAVG